MGKLLSLLARDESNCCTPQKYDVFLDFENGEPSEGEVEIYREVGKVLGSADGILSELALYKGAGREIREAITNPTDEVLAAAWTVVLPLVSRLKAFYLYSLELQRVVPLLLEELCSGAMSPTQHLESQQALVKQFADILEFVLKFDEYKMKTPAIQNDLSYYRRSVNRRGGWGEEAEVSSELANKMSLFYAQATPMLRALTTATDTFVKENNDIPIENTTETLATMAKVCLRMLESPLVFVVHDELRTSKEIFKPHIKTLLLTYVSRQYVVYSDDETYCLETSLTSQFEREETELLVLRVMVGLVILYDHIHPQGAFTRSSSVDVKGCVRLLRDQAPVKSEPLLNALRYTTKHLNEDATPKQIKNLLAA